ncbi:histidine--tRNA ligase [Candidatus Saccharibacteria bacterium]|nr:histidine--tRNA ligase [Candidatus Saccharibacteria bacterium]
MSTLSALPYKGTRDYYPEEKRVQNYIFQTWRSVVERHGYQEYGAPLLEPLEVYAAKSGDELANQQTYSFVDRGDRTVAIRPEMTPSISRMVAGRRQEMAYPARLYSIANFMRYERPQRGREREFWQLNADIFGVDSVLADAEIIEVAHDIMRAFGAKDDMYTIRVNNRGLIDHMMTGYLGLDGVGSELMVKLFDRKEKISSEEFIRQASDIFGDEYAQAGLEKLQALFAVSSVDELPAELQESESVKELTTLFGYLHEFGVTNARFDITLMRGLDYYTGMVFEVFDLHQDNNRAMFGGGRYDGLVGLFGAEPIPTVGFAPGLTTTELFLRTHNLLPELYPTTDVVIVIVDESTSEGLALARTLRDAGVNVEVDISGRKIDKQIKSALKKNVPYMLFVGAKEVNEGKYNLKDTRTSHEENLSVDNIITKLRVAK